jgi:predicted nucleotidyltransferase
MQSPETLAKKFGNVLSRFAMIRCAFLFGSRARTESPAPRTESDVDLALAFESKASEEERLNVKLDIIDAITEAIGPLGERLDITDLETANSAVAFRAIRDGILVYERTRAERVQVVARVCARAADDAYNRDRATQLSMKNLMHTTAK